MEKIKVKEYKKYTNTDIEIQIKQARPEEKMLHKSTVQRWFPDPNNRVMCKCLTRERWNLPKFTTWNALRKHGDRKNHRFENDTTRIEKWQTTISPGQKSKESHRESSMLILEFAIPLLQKNRGRINTWLILLLTFVLNFDFCSLIAKYQTYLIMRIIKNKTPNFNYIVIYFWFLFLRNRLSKIINFDYLNCIEPLLKNKSYCLRKRN